jgi:EamA domain-containing membrane protein RarD
LAVVDIIAFGLTKYIYSVPFFSENGVIPTILYGGQIWLFYYGLKSTSMTELNIVWNIFSSILVTILGIYYFSEKLNNIKTIAVLLGIISIVLFSLNSD